MPLPTSTRVERQRWNDGIDRARPDSADTPRPIPAVSHPASCAGAIPMSASRLPEVLTVAELVHHGPLAKARMLADVILDAQVRYVVLVSDLDQTLSCLPNTAIVLHTPAAQGGWALESALRAAWERTAACVIAPADSTVSRSTIALAEDRKSTRLNSSHVKIS